MKKLTALLLHSLRSAHTSTSAAHRTKTTSEPLCGAIVRLLVGIATLVLPFLCLAQTNVDDTEYERIVEKNPFRLIRTVVQLPPSTAAALGLLSNYRLTGVAAEGTNKCAYIAVAVPNQPSKYYTVVEGEELAAVKVLEIDVEAGTVTLNTGGAHKMLSFETHGFKESASPPSLPLANIPLPTHKGIAPLIGGEHGSHNERAESIHGRETNHR